MGFILSVVWNGMSSPEEPANPDRERMDAISGALARLGRRQDEMVQRQDELDRRLLRIEAAVGLTAAHESGPAPPPAITLTPEPASGTIEPPPLPRTPPPLPQAIPWV